jgi:hypothetical protein
VKSKRNVIENLRSKNFLQLYSILVTGTNSEGYRIAIDKCFDAFDEFYEMPTKEALTQARERISYRFFKSQFNAIKSDFKDIQKKIKGFYVYGIDGDIYSIPRNKRTGKMDFMDVQFKEIKKVIS